MMCEAFRSTTETSTLCSVQCYSKQDYMHINSRALDLHTLSHLSIKLYAKHTRHSKLKFGFSLALKNK